ncbi:Fungal Zn2-Cys6 binuclear cluster domain-containing protein [Cladophialophora immunda]|nr:Fungal Zn2-Cys6 binuclear cluster domain-containing protein [Cladophialophora immunda]
MASSPIDKSCPKAQQPETYRCEVCWRSYKRQAHLRRHAASHHNERRHRCHICNSTFQRSDVLKRHLQSCTANPSSPTSPASRRLSCDRCVRLKKGCDSQKPCQNCQKRGVECCYSFRANLGESEAPLVPQEAVQLTFNTDESPFCSALQTTEWGTSEQTSFEDLTAFTFEDLTDCGLLDYAGIGWEDFLNLSEEAHQINEDVTGHIDGGQKCFVFLDEFTSRTGFISSFDCGSPALRAQVVAQFLQLDTIANGADESVVATRGFGNSSRPEWSPSGVPQGASLYSPANAAASLSSAWLSDPLCWTVHQVVVLIKETCIVKPRNSTVTLTWSAVSENACLQFFSPFHIRKFLELYWASWHPNISFIHRPTFDPVSCRTILLMSMVLIGACLSPDSADSEAARIWFNCVEEAAFMDIDFSGDLPSSSHGLPFDPVLNRPRLQALQAAYNVCLYQNWEGTDASKRRIRRYRFSTVLSAARDIGMSNARHSVHGLPRNNFDWAQFVAREELVRTFLWIGLFDVAFVMFNNLPPRIMVKESMYNLACPEACFQAPTAEECAAQIRLWMSGADAISQTTFCAAVETLGTETLSREKRRELAYLGPLNLFALTCCCAPAIHTLVFQYRNSFGAEGQLTFIQSALNNWRHIWKIYADEFSHSAPHAMVTYDRMTIETMWKRVGFVRHAPEFWLLTSVVVGRINSQSQMHKPRHGGEPGTTMLSASAAPEPILQSYDQTSMRQVNELIAEFKKVMIH